jgi:phosphoesterase RecJ-like protein
MASEVEVVEDAAAVGAAAGAASIAEEDWRQAIEALRRCQRPLLVTHKKPDGDAIGSMLGLGHALEDLGKQVTLACADRPDGALAKLPGADRIVTDLAGSYSPGGDLPWDLVVALDASDLDRVGTILERNPALFERLPIVDLDHHFTNDRFGTVNLVDPGAAATAEVVTLLLRRLDVTPNAAAATCLLAGMLTDSLSFQTESTTARTLRQAAALVEAGAPLAGLAYQLFRQRPLAGALVWSKTLGSLRFAAGHRIALIEVPRAVVASSGPGADTTGLSGFAGDIAGVDVGLVIAEGDDGAIHVGLRSQSVDVAALAAQFGGGGHKRAAGCQFAPPATIASARAALIPAIEAALPPL